MSETPASIKAHPKPELYEIRVKGHLDARWANQFEGLTITLAEDGDTLLTGPVIDQAALHGLLKKVRDLGMPLVSVNRVQSNEIHSYRSKKEEKMNKNRKAAILAGALYFLGIIAGVFSVVPVIDIPDYLVHISTNAGQVNSGVFSNF